MTDQITHKINSNSKPSTPVQVVDVLPKHWEVKKLGEVCKILAGYGFPKNIQGLTSGEFPFYKVGDISKNVKAGFRHLNICDNYIGKEQLLKIKAKPFPKQTTVFAKIGEGLKLNRRAIISTPGLVDNNVVGLKAIELVCDDMYLFHFMTTIKLEDYSRATTVPSVRKSDIEEIAIPIPPLPVQKAIVAKIEELLSELDNGKQQLLTAQKQLKVYRQSLLKWAFEGKLCRNYGASDSDDDHDKMNQHENQGNHKNHSSDKGKLPKGWKLVKLGDYLEKIEAGKSFKCDERTPHLNEVGVLKVSAVTWQVFNEYESKTVLDDAKINEKYFVKINDFLFSRANTLDLIGSAVIVHSVERKLMLSDKTLRFIFSKEILKSYVLQFLRSKKGRREIQRLSTGNQESMRNIGQERIKMIEIPIPNLKEQQLIVSELESKLTICDKIEETISQSLLQTETLRQSILKQAFEGKLVSI